MQLGDVSGQVSYSAMISWKLALLAGAPHTKRPPGTMHRCREAELGPGPPDPGLDGLRATVIDHCEGERESGR